jgi:predicted MPP superfamily phosphohydrolase
VVALAAVAGAAWGLFESQWVRRLRVELAVPGLPEALDGLRILHLSDLHLGKVSLNARALRKACAWEEAGDADLVVLTGDLLSRRRGEPALREALQALRPRHGTFAILGNHDVAQSRDPFTQHSNLGDLERDGAVLLDDEARTVEIAGVPIQIVGVGPQSQWAPPVALADPTAPFRILLAHIPDTVDRLPAGAFHLVLAGHMHGGQICIPLPWGKQPLLNPLDPYLEGVHLLGDTVLHVSRGTGTTLVPFRFLARPEVTLLTLRRT